MTLLDFRLSYRVVLMFATFSIVTINALGAVASGAKYLTVFSHGQSYRDAGAKPDAGLETQQSIFSQNTFSPMGSILSDAIPGSNGKVSALHTIGDFTQTPNSFPKSLTVSDELSCLALNIYFEARGEPENGQIAVGHVVMNRVGHVKFPKSVCEVIRQGGQERLNRCQFSWWCDSQSDEPKQGVVWENSLRIAQLILIGESKDPTGGALWYHADYVSPYWQKAFTRGPKIGQHIFYTG